MWVFKSLVRKEWKKLIGRIRYSCEQHFSKTGCSISFPYPMAHDGHIWSWMVEWRCFSELLMTKLQWEEMKENGISKFHHTEIFIGNLLPRPHDSIWIISKWILIQDQVPCCKNLESIYVLALEGHGCVFTPWVVKSSPSGIKTDWLQILHLPLVYVLCGFWTRY